MPSDFGSFNCNHLMINKTSPVCLVLSQASRSLPPLNWKLQIKLYPLLNLYINFCKPSSSLCSVGGLPRSLLLCCSTFKVLFGSLASFMPEPSQTIFSRGFLHRASFQNLPVLIISEMVFQLFSPVCTRNQSKHILISDLQVMQQISAINSAFTSVHNCNC